MIDIIYKTKTITQADSVYHIYFTRKGLWCYLITIQSLEDAKSLVRKEKHTDSVHGQKPALYAILEGDTVLLEDENIHNKEIHPKYWVFN